MTSKPNVILAGFMGAGKTSTGKELAKQLNFDFFDIDHVIEAKNNMSVFEIFRRHGESYFRNEERAEIVNIRSSEKTVISTGGGLWLNPDNRGILLELGWCVWLKVSGEQAWKRIHPHLSQRPLLAQSKDPQGDMAKIIQERNPLYSLCHFSVQTDGKTPKEVAVEILSALKEVRPFDLSLLQK